MSWTHEQELDLIELGEMPAKCLKGENSDQGDRIVAGRAHRGLLYYARLRRQERFEKRWGGRLWGAGRVDYQIDVECIPVESRVQV